MQGFMNKSKKEDDIPNREPFDSFRYRGIMGAIPFLNEYEEKTIGFVANHCNDRLPRASQEAGSPNVLELESPYII